jgi:glycosyltransferase involved in cell wall biosynthesis
MGIVPEAELYWLYKNSSLVVIPTLYEAGSFPLIEAMYLQAPVVCSSVTSLPETIGDSRFVFDPLDVDQISSLIMNLLNNSELREENIRNSRKRIEQMRKVDSNSHFLEVYSRVQNLN